MKLKMYQVDAFAEQVFQGNPAAVCILDNFLPDTLMQSIAAEINLSETSFVIPKGNDYHIRWFTPTVEVALCGHATLASAHILSTVFAKTGVLRFDSLSGWLQAQLLNNNLIELDFPAFELKEIDLPEGAIEAMGAAPKEALGSDDLILAFQTAQEVKNLSPNFEALKRLPYRGIIATAPSEEPDLDFVARFFAPASGIDEDPVTGSAYTKLAPYYAKKLGKTQFKAKQISQRSGNLFVNLEGDRVKIGGKAITVAEATFTIPDNL